MAKMAPEKVSASCPIICTFEALLKWAHARVPHAYRAFLLLLATALGAIIFNAINPLGIPWLPYPDNRIGIPRAFSELLPEIDAVKAFSLYREDALFVDSRDLSDYERDHIPGAINIPMREWGKVWPEMKSHLAKDSLLVLYCYGARCGLSTRQGKVLLEEDYRNIVILDYGWATWIEHGYPTIKHPGGYPRKDEGG